jgi:hypothetical protein
VRIRWGRICHRPYERELRERFAAAMERPYRVQLLPPTDVERLTAAVEKLTAAVEKLTVDRALREASGTEAQR